MSRIKKDKWVHANLYSLSSYTNLNCLFKEINKTNNNQKVIGSKRPSEQKRREFKLNPISYKRAGAESVNFIKRRKFLLKATFTRHFLNCSLPD